MVSSQPSPQCPQRMEGVELPAILSNARQHRTGERAAHRQTRIFGQESAYSKATDQFGSTNHQLCP